METTAPLHRDDLPDFRHAWFWGCTTAGMIPCDLPPSTVLAAFLAGLLVLAAPRGHRREVLLGLVGGATLVGLLEPVLFPGTSRLTGAAASGDAVILALLITGLLSGVASGLSGRIVTLPGFRAFRLLFLELCVLTGLIGGLLLLPSLHFTGAADAGGRITFAAALILLVLLVPAGLGHLLGRGLRRLTARGPA